MQQMRQIHLNGLTIDDGCIKCQRFNPKSTKSYKCFTNQCPAKHMSLEDRLIIINNWNLQGNP